MEEQKIMFSMFGLLCLIFTIINYNNINGLYYLIGFISLFLLAVIENIITDKYFNKVIGGIDNE